MRISVSASSKDLESRRDPRFGRCRCFMIIDMADMSYEVVDNQNAHRGGCSGRKEVINNIAQGRGGET